MSSHTPLIQAQEGVVRVKVDVTDDNRSAVRQAIGAPPRGAPYLAFLGRDGELVPELSLTGWHGEATAGKLLAALARIKGG